MPKHSEATKLGAQTMWESGLGLKSVANAVGVTASTIARWRDDGNWTRTTGNVDDPIVEIFGDQTAPIPVATIAGSGRMGELEQRLADAERRAREAEEEADRLRPTKKVALYSTPDEVADVLGEDKMAELVELRLGQINVERLKRGALPIEFDPDSRMYQSERANIIAELLERRSRWANQNSLRTIKLVHPKGHLIAYPLEEQFNNEKAAPGRSVQFLRDKGFKLAVPYLCQRGNCWKVAPVENGQFVYSGYCTPEHRAGDPYLNAKKIEGVSTSVHQHLELSRR